MTSSALLDAAGRRRSPAAMPGHHCGRPPRNKGRQYPADPPTVEEIVAVMRTAGDTAHGLRVRALIVVLWRAGLRISEALALAESDLDPVSGAILVRRGKGGKRREIGMDRWGWQQIQPWIEFRPALPVGALLCVMNGPTAGRPWSATAARSTLRRLSVQAGVRRRFAPHQLRHAHAVEMAREGVPLTVVQRQLGHANLGITSIYLQGIDNSEIMNTVLARPAPTCPPAPDCADRRHGSGASRHARVARERHCRPCLEATAALRFPACRSTRECRGDPRALPDAATSGSRDARQDRAVTTKSGPAAAAEPPRPRGPVRRTIQARPADVIDVFVYVVVLNLAIEYVPSVISESFTLSLLTAALLKIALELVILLKGKILSRLRAADTRRAKLAAAVALWVVAAGSKLVVLELVDLVFGDAVSLGGFISVTLLVVALLVSRAAVRRLLYGTAATA